MKSSELSNGETASLYDSVVTVAGIWSPVGGGGGGGGRCQSQGC